MASWSQDPRPSWRRFGDAVSRLGNTCLGGSPAETVSGRAQREALAGSESWARAKRWIDRAFALAGEQDHCRLTHERDLKQAQELLESYD